MTTCRTTTEPVITVDVLNMGRARNYDTALALHSIGRLNFLFTGGYIPKALEDIFRLLPHPLRFKGIKRLCLRRSSGIPEEKCVPLWAHLARSSLIRSSTRKYFLQRKIFSGWAGAMAKAPVVIAEQGEALETFQMAVVRGTKKILMMTGQSPAGRKKWLENEHLKWPPAKPAFLGCDDMERLVRRELAEMALANVLLSPSEFVTESLRLYPELDDKPVYEVHWPMWESDLFVSKPRTRPNGRSLRVLFVGGLNLVKGVMYLVRALQRLDTRIYEARFVGPIGLPEALVMQCRTVAQVMGQLPYSDIPDQYRWADVLVLPSLSEGCARVILEGMAAGLPVIATPNTGAPIEDSINGILVPPRDAEAIASGLKELAGDQVLYRSISEHALETIEARSMERYAEELLRVIDELPSLFL